ncbi:yceI_4 [Blepharisma stoltei]|uniref:Major facilitator superfamily (MFS) profile domain-containing protein n=1 Tax=Blepharisma stoltei TaxID=1481888 RepID=A0AAU9JA02_9CILI|nr:unnamed protein product [Blepharisma stoltei]
MAETLAHLATHYLDKIGWGKYQSYVFKQCFLSYMNFQYLTMSIGYYGSDLEKEWGISNKEKGLMGTMFQLGCFMGSYLLGISSDHKGRSYTLKRSSLFLMISCFIVIFSTNYITILTALFLIGIGGIGEMVVPLVIFKEFCPTQKLNKMTRLNLGFPIGGVIFCLLAIWIEFIDTPNIHNWKFMSIILFFHCLVTWILKIDMDESPGYLIVHRHTSKAEEILNKVKRINGNTDELIQINLQNEEEVSVNVADHKTQSRIKKIFSKEYIKTTLLLLVIYFAMLFGTFSIVLFMPTYLKQFSIIPRWIIIAIQNMAGIPCLYVAPFCVNSKLGRKYTMIIGQIISCVTIIFFAFITETILIIIATSIMFGIGFLTYAALFLIAAESYPTEVRNTAQGLFFAASRVGSVSAPFIGGVILDWKNGQEISLVLFGLFFLVSAACSLYLKETRKENEKEVLIVIEE